jgi:hypothetical protein
MQQKGAWGKYRMKAREAEDKIIRDLRFKTAPVVSSIGNSPVGFSMETFLKISTKPLLN